MLTILLNNAQKFYKKVYEILSLDFIYCKIEGKKRVILETIPVTTEQIRISEVFL